MIYGFVIGFAITAAVSTLFSLYKSTVLEKEIESLYDEIKSTMLQAATAEAEMKKMQTEIEPAVKNCKESYPLSVNISNFIWPVKGSIALSDYKINDNRLEINAPPNSDILAVAKGKVVSVTDPNKNLSSTDRILIIDHENHLHSIYAGLSEISVKEGQLVLEGDFIGYSSKLETDYLHFELRHCYREINPVKFFKN